MHPLEQLELGQFVGDESQCFERSDEEDTTVLKLCEALEEPVNSSAEGICCSILIMQLPRFQYSTGH